MSHSIQLQGIKFYIVMLLMVFLSSCQTSVYNPVFPEQRSTQSLVGGGVGGALLGTISAIGHPGGWIVGGLGGGYMNSKSKLIEGLQNAGAHVIEIGDTISILIPTDIIFETKDDLMEDDNYPVLNLAAKLVNKYGNAAIKIAVGTDNVDSASRNRLLSRRQAERVAAYLWQHGVNAWRLYPLGYGEKNILATNRTVIGSQSNRMIEITLNPYVTPADCCRHIRHFLANKQSWQYWGLPY